MAWIESTIRHIVHCDYKICSRRLRVSDGKHLFTSHHQIIGHIHSQGTTCVRSLISAQCTLCTHQTMSKIVVLLVNLHSIDSDDACRRKWINVRGRHSEFELNEEKGNSIRLQCIVFWTSVGPPSSRTNPTCTAVVYVFRFIEDLSSKWHRKYSQNHKPITGYLKLGQITWNLFRNDSDLLWFIVIVVKVTEIRCGRAIG